MIARCTFSSSTWVKAPLKCLSGMHCICFQNQIYRSVEPISYCDFAAMRRLLASSNRPSFCLISRTLLSHDTRVFSTSSSSRATSRADSLTHNNISYTSVKLGRIVSTLFTRTMHCGEILVLPLSCYTVIPHLLSHFSFLYFLYTDG